MNVRLSWWKWLCAGLLVYVVMAGFLLGVPRQPILNETVRNLYFHVPMWFAMLFILATSVVYAVKYLRQPLPALDDKVVATAHVGIVFGVLGVATGSLWAKFTWGNWWLNDAKLNGSAIGMLVYFAYLVLRDSFEDEQQRGRISAIYNIFAFATLIPLIIILPRLTDSLHPGNGGNPGFKIYDVDYRMRLVFYPAVVGWILLSVWIAELNVRLRRVQRTLDEATTEGPVFAQKSA
jgi:heme exporter protein C